MILYVFQPTIRGNDIRLFQIDSRENQAYSVARTGFAAIIWKTIQSLSFDCVELRNGPVGGVRHHNPHFCMREIPEDEFREVKQKLEQFGISVTS